MEELDSIIASASPEAEAIVQRARDASLDGDLVYARRMYESLLDRLSPPCDSRVTGILIRWIGNTYRDQGDLDAASDCYIASQAIAEIGDDALNLAYALNSLGLLEWQWGNLDAATERYEEAKRLGTEVGDRNVVAMISQNLGILANIRGEFESALECYSSSLEHYRSQNDFKRMATVMSNIGMLHTDRGNWDEAAAMFDESAVLCDRVGDRLSRLMVEVNRTELAILRGNHSQALELCDAAYVLGQELGHRYGLAEVHKNYGVVYRNQAAIGLAETHLREAEEIARSVGNPLLVGEVLREMAAVYQLQDRNSDALQALNDAHDHFADLQAQAEIADVSKKLDELREFYLEIVSKWGESIESKDRYTAGHCKRVADYSCRLATQMGYSEQTLIWFRMGALLHDLGKTMVPAHILNKRGALTRAEWEIMRGHAAAGDELLSEIRFPWDIRPMVRSHHERWDGKGYPDGLEGDQIPLAARILCVADVFDALTTTRSYRPAYEAMEALEIMEGDSATIFDPEPLRLFAEMIRSDIGAAVGKSA